VSDVSPNNSQLVQITGKPAVCSECHVPWCEPIPPRYPVTVSGPVSAATVTIHTPDCLYLRKVREGASA
jgi:hypothetical protein